MSGWLVQGTRDYRHFARRMRASSLAHEKRGDDTGCFGVLTGPVPTPKLVAMLEKFGRDLESQQQSSPAGISALIDEHFWELGETK